jgi:hypothetical protein
MPLAHFQEASRSRLPVRTSHRTTFSSPVDARMAPSGEKARSRMCARWALITRKHLSPPGKGGCSGGAAPWPRFSANTQLLINRATARSPGFIQSNGHAPTRPCSRAGTAKRVLLRSQAFLSLRMRQLRRRHNPALSPHLCLAHWPRLRRNTDAAPIAGSQTQPTTHAAVKSRLVLPFSRILLRGLPSLLAPCPVGAGFMPIPSPCRFTRPASPAVLFRFVCIHVHDIVPAIAQGEAHAGRNRDLVPRGL